ncbi:MAG TPA: hypothetical protein PLF42_04060, partial [Anaerolineales bacterium]|nr:hypothetical protein [Anaerolineales bacterium]
MILLEDHFLALSACICLRLDFIFDGAYYITTVEGQYPGLMVSLPVWRLSCPVGFFFATGR